MSEENTAEGTQQEQTTTETGGQESQSQSLISDNNQLAEGEWWLAEGIKGTGERPEDYLHEKYKTYADQAKGYKELQSKFGSFTGAPKDGYKLPETIDAEDELAKQFIDMATEMNMSQEGFDKGLELFLSQAGVNEEVSTEREMEKLGENAQQRVNTVAKALKNALGDDYGDVEGLVTTAESVQLAEKLIASLAPGKMPTTEGANTGTSWADIEELMNAKDENGRFKRSSDPAYNAKVEKMIADFHGEEPGSIVKYNR